MTPAMLSEDAAEAANKDVRFIEEHRSFQSSDIRVLNDTFRKLLRRFDPIIEARISYPDTIFPLKLVMLSFATLAF